MLSFQTKAVSDSKTLLNRNRVLQTSSPQIAAEEANFPCPYRTNISQLRSYFCGSLHSYIERIGLISSPFRHSYRVEAHINVHVFSCSSHPTHLTERDLFGKSAPDVGVLVWHLLASLFFLVSSSPFPWTSSFWRTRELRGNHHHHHQVIFL